MVTHKLRPTAEPERRGSARERLLAAADELFYEGGTYQVGIDRVIERAGVAKASLYDCFGSKEALIQAYLQARHEARKARIGARLEGYSTPRERLLGVFDAAADYMAEPGFRGCAFARAGAGTRPDGGVKSVCDDARGWLRELMGTLARDAGAERPEQLAQQLVLLYDGAAVAAQMEGGGNAPALAARAAAAVMLDSAIATRAARHATVPAARPSRGTAKRPARSKAATAG